MIPLLLLPVSAYSFIFGPGFGEVKQVIWTLVPGVLIYNFPFTGHSYSGTGRYYVNTREYLPQAWLFEFYFISCSFLHLVFQEQVWQPPFPMYLPLCYSYGFLQRNTRDACIRICL